MEIRIKDNSSEILDELERNIERGLTICGGIAEGYAVEDCPVDTGNLRNSITSVVDDHTMILGTAVEYAPYVEFGTGKYAANGDGRRTAWVYMDDEGNWHKTEGARPQPFIWPAIADHIDQYKRVLEDELNS